MNDLPLRYVPRSLVRFSLLTAVVIAATLPALTSAGPVVLDPGGLPVCAAADEQLLPRAIPAANGAAIVVWQDKRRGGSLSDIYALSVASNGTVTPGWPDDGLVLCSSGAAGRPIPVPDGAGGALVVWLDTRNGGYGQIYAQRVSAGGVIAAGWPADGKQLTTVVPPNGATNGLLDAIPDGAGGTYLVRSFTNSFFTPTVVVNRVSSDGALVWSENQVSYVAASFTHSLRGAVLAEDPGAGVFLGVAWVSQPPEQNGTAQIFKISAAGSKLWGASPPASTSNTFEGILSIDIAADAAGGAFSTWWAYEYYNYNAVYGQRYSSSGGPQWPVRTPAPTYQYVEMDGTGGAFLIGNTSGNSLQVHRRLADGTIPTDWTAGGIPVSTPVALGAVARSRIDDDLLLCWSEDRSGGGFDIRTVAIDPAGAAASGWASDGIIISDAAGNQTVPDVAIMSPGQFLACWQDTRTGGSDIRATRVSYTVTGIPPGGPTGTRLALGSAWPNPARDRARFSIATALGAPATVEAIDMTGRVVHRSELGAGSQDFQLDARGLAPGVYWLRVRQGNESASRRFAVVR